MAKPKHPHREAFEGFVSLFVVLQWICRSSWFVCGAVDLGDQTQPTPQQQQPPTCSDDSPPSLSSRKSAAPTEQPPSPIPTKLACGSTVHGGCRCRMTTPLFNATADREKGSSGASSRRRRSAVVYQSSLPSQRIRECSRLIPEIITHLPVDHR